MKYLIYCRKSQDREDRQILSIESQIREGQLLAKRLDLNVTDILVEEKSAKRPGREIFEKMMNTLENGNADGIICWKLDRLARNAKDGGWVIQDIDDGFVKEIVTPGRTFKNNGDDKFWMQLEFGMAKKFVDDLSDNTKRGMEQLLTRGFWPGQCPLGYLNIDDNGKISGRGYDKTKQRLLDDLNRTLKRIEPDPVISTAVKLLFGEASKGKSLKELSEFAASLGFNSRQGNALGLGTVYDLLKNPFYYGKMIFDGKEYEGAYEALITKQLFDRIQIALKDRSKPIQTRWQNPFNRLIKCASCGCAITSTTKVKYYPRTRNTVSYTYYHCTKRKGHCEQPWITSDELEKQIEEKIKAVQIDDEILEICLNLVKLKHKEELDSEVKMRQKWQIDLNYVEKRLKRLLDMRIDDELTEDEYKIQKAILVEEKANLGEKLSDSSQTTDSWLERVENFFRSANLALFVFEHGNFEEKRNLVKSLGWNLFLDNGKLIWNYKKPFDCLIKPIQDSELVEEKEALAEIWYPHGESNPGLRHEKPPS